MRRPASVSGLTLLELLIALAILVIVASMGVPKYVSALRIARIGKAKHELVTISHAIDAFAATKDGQLPLSLYQVGFGGRLDPWGVPYCYLNYRDGTGDGLEWAIEAGLVDPAAFDNAGGDSSDTTEEGDGGLLDPLIKNGSFFGAVVPASHGRAPQEPLPADNTLSVEDAYAAAKELTNKLDRTVSATELDSLVMTLTTIGDFQLYTGVPVESTRRRDRYMFPLNTDYDLFSLGPDGRTAVSLGEKVALDDVIRANNGAYYGTASKY